MWILLSAIVVPASTQMSAHLKRYDNALIRHTVRAFLVGYAAVSGPAVLKLLLALLTGRAQVGTAPSKLLGALRQGFTHNGLAMSAAVSIGGAKWGEGRVEPIVRKLYLRSLSRHRRKHTAHQSRTKEQATHAERVHERKIKALSTLVASTISSLLAIVLLQSSPTYTRTRPPYVASSTKDDYPVQESPTLDLTLFLLVRATDSVVRGAYEATGNRKGKTGALMKVLASQGDLLVFWLSCWRIMVSRVAVICIEGANP